MNKEYAFLARENERWMRRNLSRSMAMIVILFSLLVLAKSGFGQTFEYGKPDELKGLKKIFIDAGPDVTNYNRIKDEIVGAKLGVDVVSNIDDSDVMILFHGDKGTQFANGASYSRNAGTGYVTIPSADHKRPRMLMNFDDMQDKIGEKKPATKFAREFIKAYKKANGLK